MKQKKSERKWMILRNKMANCEGTIEICLEKLKLPKFDRIPEVYEEEI